MSSRAHWPDMLREHRLATGDIIDFFVDGVAVEVKLKRNQPPSILFQLKRYARHESVTSLVLVTNRAMGLPREINGKPAYYVSLGRAWL
jgi:argininosuccinate synthase